MAPADTEDFYAALGVARTATADEIKKAYRKLARKYHPDVNPGDKDAEERFKRISRAHDALADPEKRKLYDEFGEAGLQSGFDAQKARDYAAHQARGFDDFGFRAGGGSGRYSNFEDIFGDIFEGRGATGGGPQRGADAESEIQIGLLDAVRGLKTTISLDRADACSACLGSGQQAGADVARCPECHGQGRVRAAQGPIALLRTCPRCQGRGQIGFHPCATCTGSGQSRRTERLAVRIPPGVDSGSRVRVAGKGGAGFAGGPPGDLYLVVRVHPHPTLERRGNDLYMDVPITVGEATRGAQVTVPTPDGDVRVKVPPASQSGRLLRVRGRGVPALAGGDRGDLYLRVMIHVPPEAAASAEAALDTMEAAYAENPRRGLKF